MLSCDGKQDIKRPEPLEKKRRVKIYMVADGKGETVPRSDLLRKTGGGQRVGRGTSEGAQRVLAHPLAHLESAKQSALIKRRPLTR